MSGIDALEKYLCEQCCFFNDWKNFDSVEPAHVLPISMPLPNDVVSEYTTGVCLNYPPKQKTKAYVSNGGNATAKTTCTLALSLNTALETELKFVQQYDLMIDLWASCMPIESKFCFIKHEYNTW